MDINEYTSRERTLNVRMNCVRNYNSMQVYNKITIKNESGRYVVLTLEGIR